MAMHPALLNIFNKRQVLKIISGLNNFNPQSVTSTIKAANHGGATFIDIAIEPALVRLAKKLTNLPICVSAVEPEKFLPAVAAGADLIEIGNFDSFYAQGLQFQADEVLALTEQTRTLLPNICLSVTVPHILSLDKQVQLAEELGQAGADIVQTEGGTSSRPNSSGTLGLIEKASPTLAATHEISRAISIPVLCASGLSDVTVPLAIASGAAGVGVGSYINQLNSEVAMVAAVRSLRESITLANKSNIIA